MIWTFDTCFDFVLGIEGDYSDHAADPGGKTRYGITEAVAREWGYTGDMRDLPLETAKAIYKAKYWDALKLDQLPDALRLIVFDAAINSGPAQAAKWLQRALGVEADGIIGAVTIAAAARAAHDPGAVVRNMLGQRLRMMTSLRAWQTFGRGWARRIADLLEAA